MFTVCSHCHTRFRVKEAELAAADGQVRCGKCGEVFDARAALQGAPAPAAKAAPEAPLNIEADTAPELDSPLAAEAPPPADELDLKPGPRRPKSPPIEDLFAGLPDEPAAAKTPAPEALYVAAVGVHAAHAQPETPVELPSAGHKHRSKWLDMPFLHVEHLPPPYSPRPRRPATTAAWWAGIALLALLLGAQLVNADREELGRNLVLGPSLTALYAALGHPLSQDESVSDWEVSGLNVTTDPETPGALSITGALNNGAGFTQPWPLLRVVLTDRYGGTLRARDFKPDEYLPGNQPNVRLAAGQASRFRLDIVDPGADAVGFTLTPCFDLDAGRVCSTSDHD
jgi:predicted Zn finger-like uncharacterized protein